MIIKEVETIEEASKCDTLLTNLIMDEKKYNDNIEEVVSIINYYPEIYNKEGNKLFIALSDNNIVGYIYIKTQSVDGIDKNKDVLIDALYVEEAYRNQGIATALINKVKEYAKDNDIKYISINVLDSNTIAKELYQQLGFKINSLGLKCKDF